MTNSFAAKLNSAALALAISATLLFTAVSQAEPGLVQFAAADIADTSNA